LAELNRWDIVIGDKDEIDLDLQKFVLNYSLIPCYYGTDYITLKDWMDSFFLD